MATSEKTLRVLVVDDNRDGADALGLLVEDLGNQVHVTYGGTQALDVAKTFRPDLMLVDLVMPELDGSGLVNRLRQIPGFAQTRIVAITGQKAQEYKSSAMKAGFDTVLFKPIARTEIEAVLASVVPGVAQWPRQFNKHVGSRARRPLPIDEARRIRHERKSKTLTQEECEAAICDGIIRFQEEYLGWKAERLQAHLINDLLVVRLHGALTLAERQLSKSVAPGRGRDLIKAVRKQLLEVARPMLESLVHEVAGVKAASMHHDISTVTGEEVVIFSLADVPRFQ
ncbi:MAG TPA: Na-translocating system protein MpsC family protein [Planctomycetaceae bacterium]|jgi:CheY-like chemotaxis protein|nr:Na-translocating system protein MpsC family protein [Planctomycetaceae bacterium]